MKARRFATLGGLTLLLVAVLLLVPPSWVEAQNTGIIPAFVVRDNNGDVVGPVVGFGDGVGKSPIVAYDDDTAGGRLALLTFTSDKGFLPEQGQLFFENTGCQGQAYLFPPKTSGGIQALTNMAYGVGPDGATGIGSDIWLYRADSAGSGSSLEVKSNYQTTSQPDFTNAARCVDFTFTTNFVAAQKKVNVTNFFPQPYTAGGS